MRFASTRINVNRMRLENNLINDEHNVSPKAVNTLKYIFLLKFVIKSNLAHISQRKRFKSH